MYIYCSAPAVDVELDWVHGYTSGTAGGSGSTVIRVSSNLFYNAEGDPVYPAAALGVKLHVPRNPTTAEILPPSPDQENVQSQTYFKGHNDDIMCLAISPCRRYVATGQVASKTSKGKGTICVWDATDCRQLTKMEGCHQRGITSLSFSPTSDQLLSTGQDDKVHTRTHLHPPIRRQLRFTPQISLVEQLLIVAIFFYSILSVYTHPVD
jgi:microtubule-associated protein-like 6